MREREVGEHPAELEPLMAAGIDLARRTGAKEITIRYSDDEQPVIWMIVAGHVSRGGRPVRSGKVNAWTVGAALDPVTAMQKMLDDLIDGAQCQHCGRPCGVAHTIEAMPGPALICWYQFDPELVTYRRSCEGDQ